ncbi:hypothetical protein [Methylocella tundrae]|uniref:hypothetical protein n=1 Tax=Methylocella tundrae TaxID=227605 RepID=UPI00106CF159|nr:hypothetical protein [Methylocella tundrae]
MTEHGIIQCAGTLLGPAPNCFSAKNLEKRSFFAFKDPRLCRIIPFWVAAFEEMQIAPLVVIPIRSPLEVAQSLAKRDGFSLETGLLLWLRHVLDAERESRHFPRAVVSMDDLFEDWRGRDYQNWRSAGDQMAGF